MERVCSFGLLLGAILERFWRILNGFWMDFGRISGRFLKLMGRIAFQVEELALMIRATRGRSIDRSVDGSNYRSIVRSIHQSVV